ncbi:MAG TPA: hypothetical protein VEB22_07215 [Phycisphaerales bacterium]|nr:hypothetical protein [Phycisphaerales bacterium]
MDATERIGKAKAMYRRMLAQWAQDVLILRAKGLDRPTWPRSSPINGLGLVTPPAAHARPHGKAA